MFRNPITKNKSVKFTWVLAQPPVGKIGAFSLVNVFCKLSFSFGQRVFESILFWLVEIGFWLIGVLVIVEPVETQVMFLVLAKS